MRLSFLRTSFLTVHLAFFAFALEGPPQETEIPAGGAQGEILVLPRFTIFKIDALDVANASTGRFTSKLNLGSEIGWALNLQKAKILLFADISHNEINLPPDRYVSNRSQTLVGGGIGFGIYPTGKKNFELMLIHAYREQVFLRGTDVVTLTLDRMTVPDIELKAGFFPWQWEKWGLGAEFIAHTAFSVSSYNQEFRNGWGIAGRILATWDAKPGLRVIGGPLISHSKFRARIVEQTKLELGAATGFIWDFD